MTKDALYIQYMYTLSEDIFKADMNTDILYMAAIFSMEPLQHGIDYVYANVDFISKDL